MKSFSLILRGAVLPMMVALISKVSGQEINASSYQDTLQANQKKYFSSSDYGAQLENYMGTKFLVFEFPGKSANQLYLASLELLRGYTEKIELVKNRSIDSYYTKEIQYSVQFEAIVPFTKYWYNYMVICDDGKITIENPYIYTVTQEFNANTGKVSSEHLTVAAYVALLEEYSAKDKGKKLKAKRDELRTFLTTNAKTGYQALADQLNHFTDSLLMRIRNGQKLDSLEWVADTNAPVFTLSVEGLTASNNRNYMVIKTPGTSSDESKKKTQALLNFIHMDEPIEYSRNITGDRYAFYARRDIPAYVVDSYFDSRIIYFSDIYTKDNFDDFQKFVISKTIRATDNACGVANFEVEIIYAPGFVRVSIPKISKIEDGLYDWMNKQNTYRSIFSTPDNRVLQPAWKQAVEMYFNEFFSFMFRYYSQD